MIIDVLLLSSHLVRGTDSKIVKGNHPSGQEFIEDDEIVMKPHDQFVNPTHCLGIGASRGRKMQCPGTSRRADESTGGLPGQSFPDRRRGRHVARRRRSRTCYRTSTTTTTTTTTTTWGDRPVLLLIGLRLGIDGVNPIYYETIKASPASPVLPSLFSPSSTVSFHLSSVHRNSRRASLQLLLLCRITSRQFVLSRSSSSTTRHSPAIPSIHPCSRPSFLDPSSATLSFGLFRCRAQDLSL